MSGSSRSMVTRSGRTRGSAAIASDAVVHTALTAMSPSYSSSRIRAAAYTAESSHTRTRWVAVTRHRPTRRSTVASRVR